MDNTAVVADIEHAALHDGPGLRTTVFFKGCPLNCVWCHNPECKSSNPQIMFYGEKCIGCKMCDKGCFSGAKVLCGKSMSAKEIFEEILTDKPYYGENGGVTFSGGEPLVYSEVIKEVTDLCKESGIKTAIETSLCLFNEEILKNIDFIMADFKIFDREKHKKFVGADNKIIFENFKKLDALNKPFLVRTPIIPGINDDIENIINTVKFLKTLNNVSNLELLPYHPLGVSKQKALGIEEIRFEIPSKEKMEELEKYADLR